MAKIIGIDLGTSSSCMCIMDGTNPLMIPDAEGYIVSPMIIGFLEDGKLLFGHEAKKQAILNPKRTVHSIKRFIGRNFHDFHVQSMKELFSFDIVESSNDEIGIKINEKEYCIQHILAICLKKMRNDAETFLKDDVTRAVLTVPCSFNESQRQAIREAGRIAGLDVIRILTDSTAAALAYSYKHKEISETIAICDLGSGSMSISVLEIGDGVCEVLSTDGNVYVGGIDYDLRVMRYLISEFAKQTGENLRKDPVTLQRLWEASVTVRQELSSKLTSDLRLPNIITDVSSSKDLDITVSREHLESVVEDLLILTSESCRNAFKDVKKYKGVDKDGNSVYEEVTISSVNEVLLTGGMRRMPLVQKFVRDCFSKEPRKRLSPEQDIAIGAAIKASILEENIKNLLLLDAISFSLGIETPKGAFLKIIPKNTTIPTKKTVILSGTSESPLPDSLKIFQGESDKIVQNYLLAEFNIEDILEAQTADTKIEICFDIDANGILHVKAKAQLTGKERSAVIKGRTGFTEEKLHRILEE